ncbi:type IV pilin-like G/H family protein [Microcoleus sp. herbarium12]|uniref:type IV pilin-like G/H family protein n=1 Tax=Microcoleus sp. herbarium12 TaxID=3055437 RepID=UPI002FD02928
MRQENSKPAYGCGCLVLLMLCIGVLTAIAFPSFLTSANNAKQSEGKQYVGSMNRAQQAKFAENSAFSDSIPDLELSIKTGTNGTKWYNYSIRPTKTAVFHYALAKEEMLKSYVGGVFIVPAKTTSAILCKADTPGTIEPAQPIYQNGKLICGKGTTAVTK